MLGWGDACAVALSLLQPSRMVAWSQAPRSDCSSKKDYNLQTKDYSSGAQLCVYISVCVYSLAMVLYYKNVPYHSIAISADERKGETDSMIPNFSG